jgi:hypothetical protein
MLSLSWVTVCYSLPSCNTISKNLSPIGNRNLDKTDVLKLLSVLQSCCIAAFAFALLITAKTFGSYPKCNYRAVVVILRPFPALGAGRVVLLIVTAIICIVYTSVTIRDYGYLLRKPRSTGENNIPQSGIDKDVCDDVEKNLQNLEKDRPSDGGTTPSHRVGSILFSNSCT